MSVAEPPPPCRPGQTDLAGRQPSSRCSCTSSIWQQIVAWNHIIVTHLIPSRQLASHHNLPPSPLKQSALSKTVPVLFSAVITLFSAVMTFFSAVMTPAGPNLPETTAAPIARLESPAARRDDHPDTPCWGRRGQTGGGGGWQRRGIGVEQGGGGIMMVVGQQTKNLK